LGAASPEEASAAIVSLALEARGCDEARLGSGDVAAALLGEMADIGGLTPLGEAHRELSSRGVAAVLLVSESHLAARTWPSLGYAMLDIVSCKAIGDRAVERLRLAIRRRLACAEGVSAQRAFCGTALAGLITPGKKHS